MSYHWRRGRVPITSEPTGEVGPVLPRPAPHWGEGKKRPTRHLRNQTEWFRVFQGPVEPSSFALIIQLGMFERRADCVRTWGARFGWQKWTPPKMVDQGWSANSKKKVSNWHHRDGEQRTPPPDGGWERKKSLVCQLFVSQ
jgi:hypothetical protein